MAATTSMANFLLRVQSPLHGTKRITTSPYQKVDDFLLEVKSAFDLPRNGWTVWMNREKSAELKSTKAKTLNSYKFKNGDMLYLDIQPQVTAMLEDNLEENGSKDKQPSLAAAGALLTGDSDDAARALNRDPSGSIVEDEVDQFLWKQDGTIPREKNEQLCRHGPKGKCFHCVPYEPYDEEYLAKVTPPIKFLSFHSYLRKLTGGVDKGKFAQLENLSCKIKPGCREHPPWPGGICTKCQPNAITLQRQKYRHVDFIQFENHLMVERFLDYWRKTGNQRLGYLYGRYEYHKDVPLGIKAVVSAIYEPLQVSTKSSIELVQDEDEVVNSIAAKLGLRKVGWIFTDLVPLDTSTGTVKHFRGNVNSHFLSAEECIMAADLQNRHPNPCRLSPEGHFGSKFVTVVVTGDSQNQIHFDGYQVSNQCMALVRDDCLVPTKDASELGYAKESTNEQYVPDVFYKVTDRYGNEVTQLARPLPVEYLLLDMAVAFPKELAFTFYASEDIRPFSIEHREGIGETQEFTGFAEYLTQFNGDRPMNMFCDLHLLTYLASCDMLPLKSKMDELLQALITKNEILFQAWLQSEEWATVEELLAAQSSPSIVNPPPFLQPPSASLSRPASGPHIGTTWSCEHCTFLNPMNRDACDMCGLPKA